MATARDDGEEEEEEEAEEAEEEEEGAIRTHRALIYGVCMSSECSVG